MSRDGAESITLRDGRRLAYAEYGYRRGFPVFYFHGTPGSRLEGEIGDEAGRRVGVRLIAIDRPGIGLSTSLRKRKLLDWPDDVAQLADALGIDRFGVIGLSGGGPHAAACAYKLDGRRLTATALVSAALMAQPGYLKRMGRVKGLLARGAFRLGRLFAGVNSRFIMVSLRRTPSALMPWWPDARIMRQQDVRRKWRQDLLEGFRQGSGGATQDFRVILGPPGFRVEDIRARVFVWHGTKDILVRAGVGRYLAEAIPNAESKILPGEGHLLIIDHIEEILRALAAASRPEAASTRG